VSLDIAEGGQQIVEPEAYSDRHDTSGITIVYGEQERQRSYEMGREATAE
jgi:hypothetical protein